MESERRPLRVGQFSESPVLAVARSLRLHEQYDVDWITERVTSSPGQFASLANGELDLAITSPDNVLLYATTDQNPAKVKLGIRILRPIDRGLGLAIYTSESISTIDDFKGSQLGVDVMSSGFALLLLRLLADLGVDNSTMEFVPLGATPRRLASITTGEVAGSILNAETAIAAEAAGLRKWSTSTNVTDDYLGTVLVQLAGPISAPAERFLKLWEHATQTILHSSHDNVVELLAAHAPALANEPYVWLIRSKEYGCLAGEEVTAHQLQILAEIRSSLGAYTPSASGIDAVLAQSTR